MFCNKFIQLYEVFHFIRKYRTKILWYRNIGKNYLQIWIKLNYTLKSPVNHQHHVTCHIIKRWLSCDWKTFDVDLFVCCCSIRIPTHSPEEKPFTVITIFTHPHNIFIPGSYVTNKNKGVTLGNRDYR